MRALAAAAVAMIAVACGGAAAHAQSQGGPDPARYQRGPTDQPPIVELYSFGVGPVVFEKFGHSALCLTYLDRRGAPVCFNYGMTDFAETEALVWGFMRSKQRFWVEPTYLATMLGAYSASDRDIWVQRLPLTPAQARAIEAQLWGDLAEDRRYYIYHHFDDNCTTRLRDMIDDATGGALRADSDGLHPMTYREFGQRGMAEFTPLLALSDFITGRNLDRRPTMWAAMFHPDELRLAIADRLGVEPRLVHRRQGPPFPSQGPTGRPWVVVISLLLTAPLVLVRWRGRRERAALVLATVPLIVLGILIWSLFVLVTIDWVRWNEAMLLFVPTDIALLVLSPGRRRRYAQIRVGMVAVVSLLCAIGIFKQPLWVPALVAFLPLAVIGFATSKPSPVP